MHLYDSKAHFTHKCRSYNRSVFYLSAYDGSKRRRILIRNNFCLRLLLLNYSGFEAHNSCRYIISAVSFSGKMHNMKMRQIKAALLHFQKNQSKSEREQPMVKRGEIYYADLSPVIGSEQGGIRPVLVVQNDVGNRYSPTVIAAAITSKLDKARMPTHIALDAREHGLSRDSVVLLEQIRTIDKRRLRDKIGELSALDMQRINRALLISLGFPEAK